MKRNKTIKKIQYRRRNHLFGSFLMLCAVLLSSEAYAQESKEQLKELEQSKLYLSEAELAMEDDKFVDAEVDYRRAISLNPKDEVGKYNLGTAYYDKEKNEEAMSRFKQAAEVATSKPEKHKAFHNLGNTFMNAKNYQGAVEAYKNALRNNPTDDETRYNLALAKEMLEKNPPQGGGGDDDKQEDQENQDQQQNQENKDDQNEEKEGDEGEEKEDQDQGEENDEDKQGDKEGDQGNPEQPKEENQNEGDEPKQQQQVPGQLSPQQIKNLLEAMNNEEKKVQDKINAKKQKGIKVKSEKDW